MDYGVMHHKMDRMNLDPDEYESVENDLQIMEVAALNCIYKKT
jgi:hypothetical protein